MKLITFCLVQSILWSAFYRASGILHNELYLLLSFIAASGVSMIMLATYIGGKRE